MVISNQFEGYVQLYESEKTIIGRAQTIHDNQHVILKQNKIYSQEYDSLGQFQQEYHILTLLKDLNGVINAYDLIRNHQQLVVVLEDIGGVSFDQLIKESFSIPLFLQRAIRISEILGDIHSANVIHKDINPSNIIINPQTGLIKIIDFGISMLISLNSQELLPIVSEGSYNYMSPEQTGRMNRSIDFRTDIYSLGITFYEMLTGIKPFTTQDPLEMIHCHIAKKPVPPHKVNSSREIPIALSDIIMKMLAKRPEDRYQSAWGLKSDLEECHHQWQTYGTINEFKIAHGDKSDRFIIPKKLYGRDSERSILLAAYSRLIQTEVESSQSEILLISGYSGIGKTALVQELCDPIKQTKGYMISGKFEQLQRKPYSALIYAFSDLMRILLTESEEKLQQWRSIIQNNLGANAQVLVDVIPELEKIIGKQPPVPDLQPEDAQNRFIHVFNNLIHAFTLSHVPLVLFLDDLQWTDLASLKLIQSMMIVKNSQLLFIGAFRDNEVGKTHPLRLALNQVRKNNVRINHIVLSPLMLPHIQQMISEILDCPSEAAFPLAELIYSKTNGNPFFMSEFLKSLYAEHLLFFDQKSRSWRQHIEKIREQNITDNVVDLMSSKILKLSSDTQKMITYAACIGTRFSVETLAMVCEQSESSLMTQLGEAVVADLLVPLTTTHLSSMNQSMASESESNKKPSHWIYKFSHDRIQQAAYLLLKKEKRQRIHRKLARLLCKHLSEESQEERLFEIVEQYNIGIDYLQKKELIDQFNTERIDLAMLNLRAGRRAKASTAYESALIYFQMGIKMLDTNDWQDHYTLSLHLYIEAIESSYVCRKFTQMDQLISLALTNVSNLQDQIKIYEVMIKGYTSRNMPEESLRIALDVLKRLKVKFPEHPKKFHQWIMFLKTSFLLACRKTDSLIHLKQTKDPEKLAISQILASIWLPVYVTNPDLVPFLVFKSVIMSLKYGNAPLSPMAYAAYGVMLCVGVGDIKKGYHYGQIAVELARQMGSTEIMLWTNHAVNCFIRHWKEDVRDYLSLLQESCQNELKYGSLAHAAYSAHFYCTNCLLIGKELPVLAEEMAFYSQSIAQIRQDKVFIYNEILRQAVLNILGESNDPSMLIGEAFNEEKMLPILQTDSDQTGTCVFYFIKMILYYATYQKENARKYADLTRQVHQTMLCTPALPCFYHYESLILLSEYPTVPRQEQLIILARIASNQKQMKRWARHAPMNYLHRYYLVKAEFYRVSGKHAKAVDLYDKAIALLKENHYISEEGIAHELFARFYIEKGNVGLAQIYLKNARHCFMQWGGVSKIRIMDKKYAQFLMDNMSTMPIQTFVSEGLSPITQTTGNDISKLLDIETVIKSSQAIAGEIVLDKLLLQLMKIIIENAGAEYGALLLENKGRLFLEAEGGIEDERFNIMQALDFDSCTTVCKEIIHYVYRTGEYVVIHDATHDARFSGAQYIIEKQPASILCSPLHHQGRITGVVYLENNLTSGAFTPARLEMIKLLSSQAAISIENARLYHNLSELNAAHERFVPHEFLHLLKKKSIVDVKPGDCVKQEMSVLFADIRSFTTLSENMSPEDNFKFINAFLSRMEPVINECYGFIDKFIGDAIMALFSGKADDAVSAGIAMLKRLHEYNQHRMDRGRIPIQIGIGINTGFLMLGTVGGQNRIDSTVISDSVNLASRIEGLMKVYNVPLLVSHHTIDRLVEPERYSFRQIDHVQVKGKSEVITIYEVFNADPPHILEGKLQTAEKFNNGLLLFEKGDYKEADQIFRACLRENPNDHVAEFYMTRCEDIKKHGKKDFSWFKGFSRK